MKDPIKSGGRYGNRKQEGGVRLRFLNWLILAAALGVFAVTVQTFRTARAAVEARAAYMPPEYHAAVLGILERQFALYLIMLSLLVVTVLLVLFLVILPLQRYVQELQDYKRLNLRGAYELRYLAQSYNAVYAENQKNRDHLLYQAEHDALTGLFNRRAFENLWQAKKTERIGLMLIDVDNFKRINDGHGHEVGDRVLKRVAELLEQNFRPTDYPCRIGGDEFSVIITDITPSVKDVLLRKISRVDAGLAAAGEEMPVVTLSVGVAFSEQLREGENLYTLADSALYRVKENGRNGCAFYQGGEAPEVLRAGGTGSFA